MTSGFDAVAARYDDDEEANPALAYMRRGSYARLAEAFLDGPGAPRLLELGSGTGTEAARLAAGGASVALLDVSPRLLERASAKVRAARADALLGAHLLSAGRVGELVAGYGPASFDGAYSSLGPLNGEPDLGPVAAGLGALVRPGGALLLSIMNRVCAVEILWFAATGRWRSIRRRFGAGPVMATTYPGGPADVATWYHTRADVARAFADAFTVEHAEALPLLWPPSYLDSLVRRFPRAYAALAPFDRRLARWPLLRDLGDHTLVRLRRRR